MGRSSKMSMAIGSSISRPESPVCSTGHCHPQVVAAIQQQAAKLLHMSGTDFYYAPQGDLAKKLAEIAPGSGAKRVFFTNSGAESVEAAFKLAR